MTSLVIWSLATAEHPEKPLYKPRWKALLILKSLR